MSVSPAQMSVSAARRRSRAAVVAAIGALAILVIVAGMYLYDHSRRDLIADGVTADGVHVGGLREDAARRKIERTLHGLLERPVTIHSGPRSWTLTPQEAALRIDAAGMAARAVTVSREGSI